MSSHQYTEELERVNKRISKVEQYFDKLDERLERIEMAILGDDKFGQEGYKERIERLENQNDRLSRKCEELENKIRTKMAFFLGAGSVGGVLGGWIATLIT